MGPSTANQAPATNGSCGVSTRLQGRHCCDIYRALPREILPLLKKSKETHVVENIRTLASKSAFMRRTQIHALRADRGLSDRNGAAT